MESTRRFREAVREEPVDLGRVLLLIAAHDHDVDVNATLGVLDRLAETVETRSAGGVIDLLGTELGFVGDHADYDDPHNSMLDLVLERRTGLPILLSAVAIEVASRVGVTLDGIGMPGHFIVRDRENPDRFFDLFAGGLVIDAAACEARHVATGSPLPWSASFLEPVDHLKIVARVLNNLMGSHRRRQRRRDAALMASLATMLPGAGPRELLTYVGALAEAGRYDRAAKTADVVAGRLDPETRAKVSAAAERYRAHLN